MLIDIIAGARPNFMKIAPLIRALEARQAAGGPLRYRLVHTGQHYDARMSGDFFEQLGIPEPDVNLEVGSGSQAEQTAAIMMGYERLLLEARSNLCLVVGDVTSTMACAIAAQKLHVPVAHVEAGIRSGDWTMPCSEHAKAVITDSGGITEETTVMGVPCLTLRDSTERPETVTTGTNELIGTDPAALAPALDRLFAGKWKRGGIPEKWDGRTGERIVAELERLLCRPGATARNA